MSVSSISSLPIYRSVSANESARIAAFDKTDPQTRTDIAYFTKQAPTLITPDALLKDYRSLSIVLGAFGMKANLQQTALLRKLITEDPTSKTSVAQKLANPTYLRFANAMGQFKSQPFANQANVDAVVRAIGTQNFEAAQDAQSPGMSDALYFKRSIQSLTTITQLMSDPRLLKVAQAATNMPDQFGTLDYSFQVKLLTKQMTMKNFQNSGYIDKFVSRYLAVTSAANASVADTTGALSILQGSGSAGNILSALLPQSSGGTAVLSLFA
jgi:hypothetical protein